MGGGLLQRCHDALWNNPEQPKDLRLTKLDFQLDYVDLFVVHSCDKLIITNDTFSGVEITEQFKLLEIKQIEIEPYAFRGIRKAPKQFVIQDSAIGTIPRNAFVGLSQVDHFWIKNVSINRIERSAFSGISLFKYIYFRGVVIDAIETEAFAEMHHVNYFYMRGNVSLSMVDEFIFRGSHIDEIMFEDARVKATDYTLSGVFSNKIELIDCKWHTNKVTNAKVTQQAVDIFNAKNSTFNRIVPGLFYNHTSITFDMCQIHHLTSIPTIYIQNCADFLISNSRIYQWHSHGIPEHSKIQSLTIESCQIDRTHTRAVFGSNIESFVLDKNKIASTARRFFERSVITKLLVSECVIGSLAGSTFANARFNILLFNENKVANIDDKAFGIINAVQMQITSSYFPRFPEFAFEEGNITDLTVLSSHFRGPPPKSSFAGLSAQRLRFTHCEFVCQVDDCETNALFFQKSIHQLAWVFEHNRCLSHSTFQTVNPSMVCTNATEIITDSGVFCRRRLEIEECICTSDDTVIVPRSRASLLVLGDCNSVSLVDSHSPQLHSVYLYRTAFINVQSLPQSLQRLHILHSAVKFNRAYIIRDTSLHELKLNGVHVDAIVDNAFAGGHITSLVLDSTRLSGVTSKSFAKSMINELYIYDSEIVNAGDLFAHAKHATIADSKLRSSLFLASISHLCFRNNSVECGCIEMDLKLPQNQCDDSSNRCINGSNFDYWRRTRTITPNSEVADFLSGSRPCSAKQNDQLKMSRGSVQSSLPAFAILLCCVFMTLIAC
uniref:Recep_L_domain domain-containing protein n=1 Tax=Panagrellus redivivus TaxID=6233 RepID=A0A7E4WE14_PANRE